MNTRILRAILLLGGTVSIAACKHSASRGPLVARALAPIECRTSHPQPDADPLTCGFVLHKAAGRVCENVALAPRRLRSAFLQGVSIRLADSSVLVAEVTLDTLDDNLVVASDPCVKPVQSLARDWRFVDQQRAREIFRSVLLVLGKQGGRGPDTCVQDSRPAPARRSSVFAVSEEGHTRRIAVLSLDEQVVPSRNSFVQFSVLPIDSAHPNIVLTGVQLFAKCEDALRLANDSLR